MGVVDKVGPDPADDGFFDLDHYEVLGVQRNATTQELRKAFYTRARVLHPDKGGIPSAFARCQEAFRVLGDARSRQVYDQLVPPPSLKACQPWPTTSRHRTHNASNANKELDYDEAGEDWGDKAQGEYVWSDDESESGKQTNEGPRAEGLHPERESLPMVGILEGAMLEVLAAQGVECNPYTQLVVTCEVCFRPATRSCSACGMAVCELCTRRMHAKGGFGMHWPVVVSPGSLSLRIAKHQMERQEVLDAAELDTRKPGYLSPAERASQQDFMEATILASVRPNRQVCYDPDLAQYYMWTQTDYAVYLAVHIPIGSPEVPAVVHVRGGSYNTAESLVLSVGARRSWKPAGSGSKLLLSQGQVGQHNPAFLEGALGRDTRQSEGGLGAKHDGRSGHEEKEQLGEDVFEEIDDREVEDGNDSGSDISCGDCSASDSHETSNKSGPSSKGCTWEDQERLQETETQTDTNLPTLAVVERLLAGQLDACTPLEVTRTMDNRFAVIALPKAAAGAAWPSLFVGDPAAARYTHGGSTPLYRLEECYPDMVVMEVDVPWWTRPEDVKVDMTGNGLNLEVKRHGHVPVLRLQRTFWRSSARGSVHGGQDASVIPELSTWTLQQVGLPQQVPADSNKASGAVGGIAEHCLDGSSLDKTDPGMDLAIGEGRISKAPFQRGFLAHTAVPCTSTKPVPKILSLSFIQPPRGEKERCHGTGCQSTPFFEEDSDRFGLASLLQASVFRATGKVYTGSGYNGHGRWARCMADLSKDVQAILLSN